MKEIDITRQLLENLGISELMLLYYCDDTDDCIKEHIYDIIKKRTYKCQLFNPENFESIFDFEFHAILQRYESNNYIFRINSTVQELFSFFFNYIVSDNIEESMFSELIIARNFKKFINLELKNIKKRLLDSNDINSYKTLYKIKRTFDTYKDYDFEELYLYLIELNPYFYRYKKSLDKFISLENKLMNFKVKNYEELIKSGEVIDYEDPLIYDTLDFDKGKVLMFKKNK